MNSNEENKTDNPTPASQTPMPRWKCHKTVQAAKIVSVTEIGSRIPTCWAVVELEGQGPIAITEDEYARIGNKLKPNGDKGYLVRYDDGYCSWSPSKAFEDGYTPMDLAFDATKCL